MIQQKLTKIKTKIILITKTSVIFLLFYTPARTSTTKSMVSGQRRPLFVDEPKSRSLYSVMTID